MSDNKSLKQSSEAGKGGGKIVSNNLGVLISVYSKTFSFP